ncbi:MAG: hypothetical protein ACK5NT_01180 [Pyrinomonadaceae bacterium]
MTDSEKRVVYNIIKLEGTSNDPNEYLWLAHVANNQAKVRKKTLYELLMTGYSSVPSAQKVELPDTNKNKNANSARTAVDSVLAGALDPTGGARFWDGTDFLAWGLHNPSDKPHPKFRQYTSVSISDQIFKTYLNNNLARFRSGKVNYYGKIYKIPAAVFNEPKNWIPELVLPKKNLPINYVGKFYYKTDTGSQELIATGANGQSIYWKVL